jgi:hypothetical protein
MKQLPSVPSVAIHWGTRRESARHCAERLHEYLGLINGRFPKLNRWYPVGIAKKYQLVLGCVSDYQLDELKKLMLKGVNRYDVPPRAPIVELGFRVSLYNRMRGDLSAGISVHCGCYSDHLDPANSVVFSEN